MLFKTNNLVYFSFLKKSWILCIDQNPTMTIKLFKERKANHPVILFWYYIHNQIVLQFIHHFDNNSVYFSHTNMNNIKPHLDNLLSRV